MLPYGIAASKQNEEGCFAISRDGGDTWDANYSSGILDRAIPCKMSVVYPGKSKTPTIYVATFNYGFYVSKDGGKTFTYLVCESYIL